MVAAYFSGSRHHASPGLRDARDTSSHPPSVVPGTIHESFVTQASHEISRRSIYGRVRRSHAHGSTTTSHPRSADAAARAPGLRRTTGRLGARRGRGFLRTSLPIDRTRDDVRPHQRRRGASARQEDLVCRDGIGWRLENDERRHDVDAGLRRRGIVLDRERRDRLDESQRCVGRYRRKQRAALGVVRRRRLQVGRRRPHVDERRSETVGAHRQDRHRSGQLEHRVRCRAGAALDQRRRTRSL